MGRLDVRDVLLHLRERGTTVFLNSHLLTEVERVCDRVAVIDAGTVVAQGTTDDLLRKPVVQIRVGDLAAEAAAGLIGRLGVLPGAVAPPTYAKGAFTVHVASPEDVPALVRTVVESGTDVYEVGLVRQSLEEAFVRLIRDNRLGSGEA